MINLNVLFQEKEGLITELRKELRVSDKEHRELLNRVNDDDIIRRIRYNMDRLVYSLVDAVCMFSFWGF